MHSKTDIKGGWVLGVVVFLSYVSFFHPALAWVWKSLSLRALVSGSFASAFALLVACPQPTPRTPSFSQNGLICGILLAIVVGKRMLLG
jgi:membrane-associated phospholipid phosphatase